MSHKKDFDLLRTRRQLDKLKWETAKELGLEENPVGGGEAVSQREENNTAKNMLREQIEAGEQALAEEGERKAGLNLKDDYDLSGRS